MVRAPRRRRGGAEGRVAAWREGEQAQPRLEPYLPSPSCRRHSGRHWGDNGRAESHDEPSEVVQGDNGNRRHRYARGRAGGICPHEGGQWTAGRRTQPKRQDGCHDRPHVRQRETGYACLERRGKRYRRIGDAHVVAGREDGRHNSLQGSDLLDQVPAWANPRNH